MCFAARPENYKAALVCLTVSAGDHAHIRFSRSSIQIYLYDICAVRCSHITIRDALAFTSDYAIDKNRHERNT